MEKWERSCFWRNNQEVTVDRTGTYEVAASSAEPCLGGSIIFKVLDYMESADVNPINRYADNIDPNSMATPKLPYACLNDGVPFPKIFLCGKDAFKFIDTGIHGATSIVWQETKDVRAESLDASCPDVDAENWATVGTGPTYKVNQAGNFRIVINYSDTCVSTYYFSVSKNVVEATYTKQDIVCNVKGRIRITNPMPADGYGYEYKLDGVGLGAYVNSRPYQSSNTFEDVPEGNYQVFVRSKAISNAYESCSYVVSVTISKKNFISSVETTNPNCKGNKGTIKATASGVNGWYRFIVKNQTGGVVANSGVIAEPKNFYLFEGIDLGKYKVEISTEDGCTEEKEVEIIEANLSASAGITKPLTCYNGEITVTATGGVPKAGTPLQYFYSVNNGIQTTNPKISISEPGNYSIVVRDAVGCTVTIPTIVVRKIVKPTASITQKNVACYGSDNGEIDITVSPADSGFTASYSTNGTEGPFGTFSTIRNLAPATYNVVVKYTYQGVECFDDAKVITITSPDAALSASAGVAQLAGCGPAGHESQGKVRITNAEGGLAPYKYSFDGGATWTDEKEAYLEPSTTPYTLFIKDSSTPECSYAITDVFLNSKPEEPTFEIDGPNIDCEGKASVGVKVTNNTGIEYKYKYFLNNVENSNLVNPDVFLNVANSLPGKPHKIKVEYSVESVPTYSVLLKEDFGSGPDTTSPGINSSYCFEKQDDHVDCGEGLWGSLYLNDGEYAVTNKLLEGHEFDFGWVLPKDHTNNGVGNGRFLAVNVGNVAGEGGILYSKHIVDIMPNQDIKVDLYALNLLKTVMGKTPPNLTVELHKNGVVIPGASFQTNDILQNEKWNILNQLSINPGDNTALDFVIRSNSTMIDGNDVAIDDIFVYQLPKTCLPDKELDVIVNNTLKFSASITKNINVNCYGAQNGSYTIVAENFNTTTGYEYSFDDGETWKNSKTRETLISDLGKGSYSIKIRYNSTSECYINLSTVIGSPLALTVTASVSTEPTCSTSAAITAVASGGSPAYTYELRNETGVTVIKAFQSSITFNNVAAGVYTVFAKDINGCISDASNKITVNAPSLITASISALSDLCYDSTNKAKIIITATGTGTLSYSLDNGPSQASNTFSNLEPGTYSVTVMDANNCSAEITGIVIPSQLTASALINRELSCQTGASDALISVTINGELQIIVIKLKKIVKITVQQAFQ